MLATRWIATGLFFIAVPLFLLLTNVRIAGFSAPHNIFVEDGWLYLCRGSGDGVAIVDLRTYDPDNAPLEITTLAWEISGAGSVTRSLSHRPWTP